MRMRPGLRRFHCEPHGLVVIDRTQLGSVSVCQIPGLTSMAPTAAIAYHQAHAS
jgi:hypothetical protein